MKKGDIVEFTDKDGMTKPGVFEREIRRGRHKGKCIVRINKHGRDKHVKVKCTNLRER
jgi:hypothetical protein